jgi:hypothetical protein
VADRPRRLAVATADWRAHARVENPLVRRRLATSDQRNVLFH